LTPRVLVCDDHPVVRDAVAACLRLLAPDCTVGCCDTACQAVAHLAGPDRWDLVVLDLTLPDARGLEALLRLRARDPATRIAVLTASDDRSTIERAMRAGAAAFVSKTADRGALLGSLGRLLGASVAAPEPLSAASHVADRMSDADVHEAIAEMSPRQLQVLRLLVRGLPNKAICRELDVTENTVKIHITAVLRALCARNRTEAVARASRVGFGGGN
jgi:DNA-binding NarL/FixJ family response regulator